MIEDWISCPKLLVSKGEKKIKGLNFIKRWSKRTKMKEQQQCENEQRINKILIVSTAHITVRSVKRLMVREKI